MSRRQFVPDRGDLVWITLNPASGHEQAGRRPALVLSPRSYNRKTGLCVICPATRQRKGYAFEVVTVGPDGQETVLLADHIRNADWKVRRAEFMYHVGQKVIDAVIARLEALIVTPDA
ncbi:MAG: endoribonuclease MazF [Planctomycetales bacterium]|nr:endoribonuclease MazF [Planctomycetales bacterium]